jgi:hypothetical protein
MTTLADVITEIPESNISELYLAWFKKVQNSDVEEAVHLFRLYKKEMDRVISLLPSLVLFKLKIFDYDDFDFIEYKIDPFEYKIKIVYKPKNINISFWTADLTDCFILKD